MAPTIPFVTNALDDAADQLAGFTMERLSIDSANPVNFHEAMSPAGPTSRLSCQIELTDDLDGLVVRVPEEQ